MGAVRSSLSQKAGAALSTTEVLCQISTFLAAGHETTSSSLAWTLYALAQNPLIQSRLRDELRSIEVPCLDGEEGVRKLDERVQALPYLDAVVREREEGEEGEGRSWPDESASQMSRRAAAFW